MRTHPIILRILGRPALGVALRTGLVRALPICLLGLAVLTGAGVAPAKLTPTESVSGTINDVIRILDTDALKQPGRSEERRGEIERLLRHRMNYEQMAQRSLGDSWTRLNDIERQEFVQLFVQLLRDTFACRIDEYSGERVLYLSEQRAGNFAEVRTRLIGPKGDTQLDFRLKNQSGEWRVYDVVIDDASLVRNYRAQFDRIIRDYSYAGLVDAMTQRALVVKVFEKTSGTLSAGASR
jgi:phospholipid transport system substrate-binding protein